MDTLISKSEKSIALLLEYKDRLISDAVTGKIDLSNVAIPDTISETESIEILDFDEEKETPQQEDE